MAKLRKTVGRGRRARSRQSLSMDESDCLCIAIRHYSHGIQSVQRKWQDVEPSLDITRCDLMIAIDAPELVMDVECMLQLYLDPADAPSRDLPENAWQVRCGQSLSSVTFAEWADDVARMLTRVLLEPAIVSVDLVDLKAFLCQSSTREMTCMLCDWTDQNQLPPPLEGKMFIGVLGALYASAEQLNLRLFVNACTLFERMTSAEAMNVFAARLHAGTVPQMLLIGMEEKI